MNPGPTLLHGTWTAHPQITRRRRETRLGISRGIQQSTGETLIVKPGSLFSALHRMEEQGWISAPRGDWESNRRAQYYRLIQAGQKQLDVETKRWDRISWAIAQAVQTS